jgi:hypothetical protein
MTTYKLQLALLNTIELVYGEPNAVIRSDGTWIPFDPDNTDYQAYLKWLDGYEQQYNSETQQTSWVKTSEGNTPLPADE